MASFRAYGACSTKMTTLKGSILLSSPHHLCFGSTRFRYNETGGMSPMHQPNQHRGYSLSGLYLMVGPRGAAEAHCIQFRLPSEHFQTAGRGRRLGKRCSSQIRGSHRERPQIGLANSMWRGNKSERRPSEEKSIWVNHRAYGACQPFICCAPLWSLDSNLLQ
ncbi:hypothetical protein TNCV_2479561 [Trichonephila clavipes]|nr:hypothetical protein TNCV_2479561 [Trichonephila clavipes]